MTHAHPTHRPVRRFFIALSAVAGGLLLALVVLRCNGNSIWDDAYFNVRYADNFLQYGTYAWNADDPPTYGLTSLLHGGVVLTLRLGFDGAPGIPLFIASLVAGLVGLGLLFRLVLHYADAHGRHRWAAVAFLALLTGFNANQLSVHFTSGMDTALAMAYLSAYLIVVKRFEGELSPGKALLIGLLGGLAWVVRPDLLIFTVGIPLALAIFAKKQLLRVQGRYLLLFTAFSLLTQFALISPAFDAFVPLSFYVKSTPSGFDALRGAYQWEGLRMFGAFLTINWAATLVLPAAILLRFSRWRGMFTIADKAALLGFLGFALYQAVVVIPVMGYEQRFFYPAWPVLVYLGAKSLVHLLYERRPLAEKLIGQISGRRRGWPVLIFGVLIGTFALLQRPWSRPGPIGQFDMKAVYAALGRNNWPYLERVSILPDDLALAATELGILGALNPNKTIYDLSGLHDPEVAIGGFDRSRLLNVQRPDLIFLPHPDYREMRAELLDHPDFRAAYAVYPREELGTFLGLALRRDSRYFLQLKFIVTDERDLRD
ncbi:MAG: hypothetical protein AAGN35_07120 [Bacteroidota bacterium]